MALSRPRRGREEGGSSDEDQQGSAPGKRPRHCSCSCSCCQKMKDFYDCQFEILRKEMRSMEKGFIEQSKTHQREMQEFYQNSQLQLMEKFCEIQEQFNTIISEIGTPGDKHVGNYSSFRAIPNQNQNITYRLKFENKHCNAKYSRHDITADDGSPIKVAIYDRDNRIITDGPLSSMHVKIVVLNGEFNSDNKEQWSGDSFHKNIIKPRPGKPPLFSKELYVKLKNGVASLSGVKFQDNSSFVPSKKFRMGVMAADDRISEKILEGISEPFSVKDGRGFAKRKAPRLSLSDPIYKVNRIGENGCRHKQLEKMQIKFVQDFVCRYNKDKDGLRKDCAKISDHDWNIIVEHALSCMSTAQETPRPRQRWMIAVTMGTFIHLWKKKKGSGTGMTHEFDNLQVETDRANSLGMADAFNHSQVEPEPNNFGSSQADIFPDPNGNYYGNFEWPHTKWLDDIPSPGTVWWPQFP